MAQGNLKKKAAGAAKKAKTQKKSMGPKKGGKICNWRESLILRCVINCAASVTNRYKVVTRS